MQAICDNYDLKVENLASLVDGKAMWCLLDYYFRKELCNDTSNKVLTLSRRKPCFIFHLYFFYIHVSHCMFVNA